MAATAPAKRTASSTFPDDREQQKRQRRTSDRDDNYRDPFAKPANKREDKDVRRSPPTRESRERSPRKERSPRRDYRDKERNGERGTNPRDDRRRGRDDRRYERDRDRDSRRERDGGRDRDDRRERSTDRDRRGPPPRRQDRERDDRGRGPPPGPRSSAPNAPSQPASRVPTTNGTTIGKADPPVKQERKVDGVISAKSTIANGTVAMDIAQDAVVDSEEEMLRVLGFRKFRSTKNTKVPGNDKLYAVRKEKKTEYRQYMNRVGGFNRPLSPSRE